MMPIRTTLVAALCVWFSVLAPAVAAEEDSAVKLMRPDSLVGWDHGELPIRGWTIREGRLADSGPSTPLLSGYALGDFRLRFQWSVTGTARWTIMLPDVASPDQLVLSLHEGRDCGCLVQTGSDFDPLAAGGDCRPSGGKPHTAEIRRQGAKFSLTVDGRLLYEVSISPNRRFGLGLARRFPLWTDKDEGQAWLSDMTLQEPPGEAIYSGKDLSGWWHPGDISVWRAENGNLVLHKPGGNYIRTKKEYANFTLSLEYRIQKGGNSGVGIRTPRPGWPSGDGMELQIWDIPRTALLDKHAAMAIYGNVPPLARADRSGQWNRVVIKADGRMISGWMNGELVQQCNTAFHPELKHRHLKGWIGVQEHGATMAVRNVRVLEAPDGLGLAAWQKPRPPSGATALLDRLMNPERLSLVGRLPGGSVPYLKDLGLDSLPASHPDIPRGWLSAVEYRREQFGWGVHREFDPRPRHPEGTRSPQKTIAPGRTEPLLRLDGAGIVHWLKLKADKKVLANNDLWLEVTIDGQKEPAISAPARFWFAPLADQGNFPNFVCTDRGGATNVLAMPFGDGIAISAANRGQRAIGDVGLIASVEPATEQTRKDVLGRMRLHGVFQTAREGNDRGNEMVHLDGSGRWVGLIFDQPADAAIGIDSLTIDGQPATGWASPDLATFLGQPKGDFRTALSGRHGTLCWRYLMLEPVDFQKSLVLKATAKRFGPRLAVFYTRP